MNNIGYDQENTLTVTSKYTEKLRWDAPLLTLLTPEIQGGVALGQDGFGSATHS